MSFPKKGKALYQFTSRNAKELDLTPGDIITILGTYDNTWYQVESKGKKGYVPQPYVKIIESETPSLPSKQTTPIFAKVKETILAKEDNHLSVNKGKETSNNRIIKMSYICTTQKR